MDGLSWANLGAILSIGLNFIGTLIGCLLTIKTVKKVLSENSSIRGQVIVFLAHIGTKVVYGILFAVLILNETGFIEGQNIDVSAEVGLRLFTAGLLIGVVGFITAICEGLIAIRCLKIIVKDNTLFGKCLIRMAIVEIFIIIALLISILIYSSATI